MTLVIASSPVGLRAGAFLAAFGERVRVLLSASGLGLRGGLPQRAATPMTHFWPDAQRETLGDELMTASGTVGLPRSRRELAGVLGAGPLELGVELTVAAIQAAVEGRGGYLGWCERSFGASVASTVCAPYLRRRFCRTDAPEWLAWWVHGRPSPETWWVPSGDPLAFQRERILDTGGDVVPDVEVLHFEVEDGRVVAVETDLGREHVDGRLWVEASPMWLAEWCPELPVVAVEPVRIWEVAIPGPAPRSFVHVSDPARPLWLAVSDGRETRAFTSLPADLVVDRRALARHVAKGLGREEAGAVARPVADQFVEEPGVLEPLIARARTLGFAALVPHRPLSLEEEESWFLALFRGDGDLNRIETAKRRKPWAWVSA